MAPSRCPGGPRAGRGPRGADVQPGPRDVAGRRHHQARPGGSTRSPSPTPLMGALGDRPVTLQRFPRGHRGARSSTPRTHREGVPDWIEHGDVHLSLAAAGTRSWSSTSRPTAVWAIQMNTVTFHPWPVRTEHVDNPDELRIDLDPQPGSDFADAVEAALALREVLAELGLTGWAKTSGNRGVHVYCRVAPDARVPRRAARRHRHRARARAPAARPRHHRLVEGGARREGLRRLQPGLPRPHHRLGLQPAAAAGRAGVDAGRLGRAGGASAPRDFTVRTVPGILAARRATPGPASTTQSATSRPHRAVGQGRQRARAGRDALPARLPQDAGRAAAGAAEQATQGPPRTATTSAPKAERDADVGPAASCRPCRPDAGQVGQGHARGRVALRAQVGRVPLDRLPLRRPGRDRQPQREADDPLLPGGRGGGQGEPAGQVRRRRRDRRDRAGRRPARLRPAAAAHPPCRQPGEEARRRRRRRTSSRSTCSRWGTTTCASGPSPSGGRCSRRPSPGPRRRSTSPAPRATARSPRSGSSSSRARARRRRRQAARRRPTSPTSG